MRRLLLCTLIVTTAHLAGAFTSAPLPLQLLLRRPVLLLHRLPKKKLAMSTSSFAFYEAPRSHPSPIRIAVDAYRQVLLVEGREVAAEEFLAACKHTTTLLDRLGKVFYPIKSDIEGNIKKLQAIAETKPHGVTLQALVREEKVADTSKVGVAGDSLLWLKRAMQFMNVFLGTVSRGGEANAAAKDAYITTLQNYHGFVMQRTFSMGLMAAPGTDTILSLLGGDGADPAQTRAELAEWVAVVTPLLLALDVLLVAQGIEHP